MPNGICAFALILSLSLAARHGPHYQCLAELIFKLIGFSWRCQDYSASYFTQPVDLRKRVIPETLAPTGSCNISVGITTMLRAERSWVRIPVTASAFSLFSKHMDRLWSQTRLLLNGHRLTYPGLKRVEVKLITHPHLMPRLRMSGAILHTPIYQRGVDRETSRF
jgi:hypothetical protein